MWFVIADPQQAVHHLSSVQRKGYHRPKRLFERFNLIASLHVGEIIDLYGTIFRHSSPDQRIVARHLIGRCPSGIADRQSRRVEDDPYPISSNAAQNHLDYVREQGVQWPTGGDSLSDFKYQCR